jgi:TPR repeat protein
MSTRTFKRASLLLAVALAFCGPSLAPARAFDGASSSAEDHLPLSIFKNPKAALQAGLDGVRKGHARAALAALQFAADSGESLAQWKLGKMYASGDGVPQDDAKAFDYFSQIVENYDEDQADPRQAPFVSSAFVALGVYDLRGIANTRVVPNPERALEMFHYAAVNFGDAAAQYNMARMYLDGEGVARDGRQAARWLYLAAEKGHIESEAVLGQLLFNGYDGVPPQRAKGLMWLSLAHDGITDKVKDQWILDLYSKAMSAASDADRQIASMFLDDRSRRAGPPLPSWSGQVRP